MSRINTNVTSLNAQRNISQTNQAFGRTVGRLSSGFRINRAADDAAGLGIANKLRGDIRALKQASSNATQANSLLQVAEGASNQVSSIVDRMKELASQSASDSVNNDDRQLIQAEFTQLQSEIDRIVSTTKFQGATLLNGSLGASVDEAGSSLLTNATDAASFQSVSASGAAVGTYTLSKGADDSWTLTNDAGASQTLAAADVSAGRGSMSFTQFGVSVETTAAFVNTAAPTGTGEIVVAGGQGTFMVSASGDYGGNDTITLEALDLRTASLGIDGTIDVTTRANSVLALTALDAAVADIAGQLGDIGAAQNRIDFAQANVATTIENFSAAESVIRDADFAAEASEFARLQILQQSQVAMLAQANSAPQGVLQLIG